MKLLFDLLPVILFFVSFKFAQGNTSAAELANAWLGGGIAPDQAPVLIATAVAIVPRRWQVGAALARGRKVDTRCRDRLPRGGLIVVFGGLTLWLHDETFIKWKPTILYWLFASPCLVEPRLRSRAATFIPAA
ncbi:MAG: septation protein IspZ [Ideonella sp.]|nr:septation protein IspZ [Ideonella sp.]